MIFENCVKCLNRYDIADLFGFLCATLPTKIYKKITNSIWRDYNIVKLVKIGKKKMYEI